jgi:putative ATP-binding cassette transporter
MDRERSMRRRLAFSPGFDSAAAVVASVIGKNEPRLAWIVMALAALTALLDRFAVLCVTDAVYDQGSAWRMDLVWVLAAIAGAFLLGRWTRMVGLGLAERASDTVLIAGTRRVLATEWRCLGADGPGKTLTRLAIGMREDASQAAASLPALAALPITAAWLSLHETGALLIVVSLSIAGTVFLRREISRIRASETVLDHAEAAFDRVTARVLAAGSPLRLTSTHQPDFCTQALWPAVDDATRAASIHARAHARVAGLFGWLVFLLVIVLLTFASGSSQDSNWTRALIVIAATLHHARRASAAYLAVGRIGTASARIDAIAESFPAAETSAPVAPARWTTIAFRQARVEERDTPNVFLAPIGPLDMELHRGEIVALTGSSADDRGTLLHLLCGLVPPDSGTVLLDGRAISPAMLRGLCGGVLDRDAVSRSPLVPTDASRTEALLARFDLSPPMLHLPEGGSAAMVLGNAERIRLAVVIAELEDRPIRLYDERAARLEPRFRDAFAETLREARARGRTCIVATDDAGVISAADRVLCMQDGIFVSFSEAAQ